MGERIPRTDEATGSSPVCSMIGEMREWLNRHDWKSCVRENVPWVRIPLSPPFLWNLGLVMLSGEVAVPCTCNPL